MSSLTVEDTFLSLMEASNDVNNRSMRTLERLQRMEREYGRESVRNATLPLAAAVVEVSAEVIMSTITLGSFYRYYIQNREDGDAQKAVEEVMTELSDHIAKMNKALSELSTKLDHTEEAGK